MRRVLCAGLIVLVCSVVANAQQPEPARKQAVAIRDKANPEVRAWAEVDETIKVDGYNWVKKAMSMASAPSAEMEFAASLMTQGSTANAHRAKALAAAPKGSLLAKNLANMAY